ncbi:hypothetical protein [Absidia glauca]|uniref:Uncharacterized protein n=1 Tax=Absidia glauca TaxID=4829 RepID=A0A168LGV0_ABSGL|nr:hypothetical protein [Absidia glauca]
MEDQLNNQSLDNVPGAVKFLDELLQQPMDDLLQYLWANGYEGCTDEERSVNNMIRYILTDFHLNCTITTNNDNERTPFCQRFIPIFKAFAGVTRLMDFTWCEKGLLNNRLLSLGLPKSMLHRTLLDGIAIPSHCLKMDLALYKRASFDTFLKRQVFGIQFIGDKMTLTSSRLISPTRYAFIEVRSAVINRLCTSMLLGRGV